MNMAQHNLYSIAQEQAAHALLPHEPGHHVIFMHHQNAPTKACCRILQCWPGQRQVTRLLQLKNPSSFGLDKGSSSTSSSEGFTWFRAQHKPPHAPHESLGS